MISTGAKSILGFRPNIKFVAPHSGLTIPEVDTPTTTPTPKETRVSQILQNLLNIATAAEAIEKIVAARASDVVLKLDLNDPEDAVVAQAVARQFPESTNTIDGVTLGTTITFDMFNHCLQEMKQAGKQAGLKQQMKAPTGAFKADKTDFGGRGKDKRPSVNKSTIPFAPLNIPAFIAAGIPILFGMLYPLINLAIKKDIVGHAHADPTSGSTGPGVPVVPL